MSSTTYTGDTDEGVSDREEEEARDKKMTRSKGLKANEVALRYPEDTLNLPFLK